MPEQEWSDARIIDTHKTLVFNHMLSWTHAVTKIAGWSGRTEDEIREVVRTQGGSE